MSDDMKTVWAEFQTNRDPALKEQLLVNYLPLVKIVASRMKVSLLVGSIGPNTVIPSGGNCPVWRESRCSGFRGHL